MSSVYVQQERLCEEVWQKGLTQLPGMARSVPRTIGTVSTKDLQPCSAAEWFCVNTPPYQVVEAPGFARRPHTRCTATDMPTSGTRTLKDGGSSADRSGGVDQTQPFVADVDDADWQAVDVSVDVANGPPNRSPLRPVIEKGHQDEAHQHRLIERSRQVHRLPVGTLPFRRVRGVADQDHRDARVLRALRFAQAILNRVIGVGYEQMERLVVHFRPGRPAGRLGAAARTLWP